MMDGIGVDAFDSERRGFLTAFCEFMADEFVSAEIKAAELQATISALSQIAELHRGK
jgi:hypothetical protein